METVKTKEQITSNVYTLNSYRNSINMDFYKDTLERGVCYVTLRAIDKVLFAPSRFVGYIDNKKEKHLRNYEKHGGETNVAIRRILGEEKFDEELELQFLSFCGERDLQPYKKKRRYWNLEIESYELDTSIELLEDLQELNEKTPTAKEILSLASLGQGKFRKQLIDYWGGCCVTGSKLMKILKASHIKPWRFSSDLERLDPFNGLLLSPQLDALFDGGYISFDAQGIIMISPKLPPEERMIYGLSGRWKIELTELHQKYMDYHRKNRFRKG